MQKKLKNLKAKNNGTTNNNFNQRYYWNRSDNYNFNMGLVDDKNE